MKVKYYPEAVDGDTNTANRMAVAMEAPGIRGPAGQQTPAAPTEWELRRYDFTIQFCWQKTPRSKRNEPAEEAPADEYQDTVSVGGAVPPAG